jgi:hypothetical protein
MENRLSVYETPCLLPGKAFSTGFQTADLLYDVVRPRALACIAGFSSPADLDSVSRSNATTAAAGNAG